MGMTFFETANLGMSGGIALADARRWNEFADWIESYSPRGDLAGQLHFEALSLARAGDLRGAADRLRLYTEPKWHSEEQCRMAYNTAMGRS